MRFSIPGAAYFFLSPPPFKYFFPKTRIFVPE